MKMERRNGFLLWLFAAVVGMALHAPIASAVNTVYRNAIIYGTGASTCQAALGQSCTGLNVTYWNSGDHRAHVHSSDGTEYAIPQTSVALAGGYATVDNAGTPLAQRATVNYGGTAISCVDNSGNARTDCTINGYGTVDNAGTPLTQRATVNYAGTAISCVDNSGSARTDCTINGYGTVDNAGTPLTQRATVNYTGTGVSCVDNSGNARTDCTINGYGTTDNAGTPLTQRATLNMTGSGVSCVDNAGASRTDCTIKAPGGFNALDFGADNTGATTTTTAVQSAIDAAFATGGGIVRMPHGVYKVVGLVLKSGVRLVGDGRGYNESSIYSTRLVAASTGIVIDTLVGGATMASVEDMVIAGLGAGTAAKGIRVQAGNWNLIKNVEVTNMADECILLASGTVANKLVDVLAINCVLNRTRAGITGAVDIAGADHYLDTVEASTSQVAKTDANLYCVAIAIRGTNNMLSNCVGEISDQGYWIGTGSWNRLTNCRADLNFGHGFRINGGGNVFSSCQATRNSQDADNTYNGFEIDASTAQGNKFAACISSGLAADAKWPQWGFDDNAAYTAVESRNTFAACGGSINRTRLWHFASNTAASGMDLPPHIVNATNGDTAPNIEGSSYLGLFGYTAGPTAITNFTNGVNGQTLFIYGDNDASLTYNGGQMITNTAQSKRLRDGSLYAFKNNNGIWRELNGDQTIFAEVGASIASATTIAPTRRITEITGTTTIQTITVPTNCTQTGFGCDVRLVFIGVAPWNAVGNIAVAGTPTTANTTVDFSYVAADAKWYPSRTSTAWPLALPLLLFGAALRRRRANDRYVRDLDVAA